MLTQQLELQCPQESLSSIVPERCVAEHAPQSLDAQLSTLPLLLMFCCEMGALPTWSQITLHLPPSHQTSVAPHSAFISAFGIAVKRPGRNSRQIPVAFLMRSYMHHTLFL
jgi:hypothetical protein